GGSLPLGNKEPLTANFERSVRSNDRRVGSPPLRAPRQGGMRALTGTEGHLDLGGFLDPFSVGEKRCRNRARQFSMHQPLHQVKDGPSMIDKNPAARCPRRPPPRTWSAPPRRFDP